MKKLFLTSDAQQAIKLQMVSASGGIVPDNIWNQGVNFTVAVAVTVTTREISRSQEDSTCNKMHTRNKNFRKRYIDSSFTKIHLLDLFALKIVIWATVR